MLLLWTHWGRLTPYGVGKFHKVSVSGSGFLMLGASFRVPTCLCFDQWLLRWLVMQTAAASSAAAVCIARRFGNRWPRFPTITRPRWVKWLTSHRISATEEKKRNPPPQTFRGEWGNAGGLCFLGFTCQGLWLPGKHGPIGLLLSSRTSVSLWLYITVTRVKRILFFNNSQPYYHMY